MVADMIDFTKRNKQTISVFGTQIRGMCCEEDRHILEESYDDEVLYDTAVELVAKRLTLSKKLCDVMEAQLLPPRDAATGLINFEASFLESVRGYFRELQKPLPSTEPEEAMQTVVRHDESMMRALLALPRELCASCSSYRPPSALTARGCAPLKLRRFCPRVFPEHSFPLTS